jgi:3'-5' exoribonuclease
MTEALPGPREWIGSAPFPWPPAHAVGTGELFHACFFLVGLQVLRTKADKPYLRLQLQDAHGAIEGRVWDMAEQIAGMLRDGIYIGVRGRVEVFNGERQLKVEEIAQIHVGRDELEHFMPRSPRDPGAMDRELAERIASVQDVPLRTLLERMLAPNTDIGAGYRLAPAAKYNHHAYLGGLIEHTLSIVAVCDMLAEHYQPHVDRDLLIAGALLHDVGKVREIGARAGFPYTDEGKLLGHITLGMQMVADTAAHVEGLSPQRLTLLQHLIASHQGRYEWQSPREPRTLEAYILHYADDLDAKMQHAIGLVGTVPAAGAWSSYDRSLGRELYRHHLPPAVSESAPAPDRPQGPGNGDAHRPEKHAVPRPDAVAASEPVATTSPEAVSPSGPSIDESVEDVDADAEDEVREAPATLDLFD